MQCWHHYSNDVIHCAIDQMERLHNWQVINIACRLAGIKSQVTLIGVRNHAVVFTHSLGVWICLVAVLYLCFSYD